MARRLLKGGVIPSDELQLRLADHIDLRDNRRVDGSHYSRTAKDRLARLDGNRDAARLLLGSDAALHEWRAFFMACAELFGYARGQEWIVSHYLLEPR